MMKKVFLRFENFWFRPISTKGFGLMRIGFGLVAFTAYFWQWTDVTRYYSDEGLLPREIMQNFLRNEHRYSILNYVGEPEFVFAIYLALLISLLFVIIGHYTKPALLIAVLLIFSFHERMPVLLAGGDTVLRHIAFVLILSPCHRSFSLWSLKKRYKEWKLTGKDLIDSYATMPIWPYRLLLFQFAAIYTASVWTKLYGNMWREGHTALIALHHEHFARFPVQWANILEPLDPFLTHFALLAQIMWPLLMVIYTVRILLPFTGKILDLFPFKRITIFATFLLHLGIFIMMDVGIFSLIIFVGYLGLLLEEDFEAIRGTINRTSKNKLIVLYDGKCGFCKRSVFTLYILDHLHRLEFVNFHSRTKRQKIAPKLKFADLDRALHVKLSDGSFRAGFSAFRAMTWHMPIFWLFAPILYLPGVQFIGDKIYTYIALRRKTCTHECCSVC